MAFITGRWGLTLDDDSGSQMIVFFEFEPEAPLASITCGTFSSAGDVVETEPTMWTYSLNNGTLQFEFKDGSIDVLCSGARRFLSGPITVTADPSGKRMQWACSGDGRTHTVEDAPDTDGDVGLDLAIVGKHMSIAEVAQSGSGCAEDNALDA